jgi:hypothetical protein
MRAGRAETRWKEKFLVNTKDVALNKQGGWSSAPVVPPHSVLSALSAERPGSFDRMPHPRSDKSSFPAATMTSGSIVKQKFI